MRALLLFLVLSLAGCASEPERPCETGLLCDEPPEPGTIRAIVVDEAILPLEGATVHILNLNRTATTDASGAADLRGLEPGTYVVEARHPL